MKGKCRVMLDGKDYSTVKRELGFISKQSSFGWQPILSTRPFESKKKDYLAIEITEDEILCSAGQAKAAGLPIEFVEETWEVSAAAGKLSARPKA